ncbi:hypothetical protein C8F01DRAFT_713305 [Mycena amicta]|nr:hypothetical protein C8F01DRAFT_713305 [Mycena amicta]
MSTSVSAVLFTFRVSALSTLVCTTASYDIGGMCMRGRVSHVVPVDPETRTVDTTSIFGTFRWDLDEVQTINPTWWLNCVFSLPLYNLRAAPVNSNYCACIRDRRKSPRAPRVQAKSQNPSKPAMVGIASL